MKDIFQVMGKDRKLAELLAFLILEKGMRYQDIFGEKMEGFVEIDGKKHRLVVEREGIPLPALIELSKFLVEFARKKKRVR